MKQDSSGCDEYYFQHRGLGVTCVAGLCYVVA